MATQHPTKNPIMQHELSSFSTPSIFKDRGFRRLFFWQVCLLVSQATVGYDEVLVGSLQAMPSWGQVMGNPGPSFLGLLVSIVFIGGFIGAFAAAPVSDRFGRKACVLTGSCFCIVGTILQATAPERGVFLAGRLIIGFGISFTTNAGPTLVNELAHPSMRGTIASFFNVLCHMPSNSSWCWRIPSIIQGVPAIFVAIAVLFMPESPRFLYSKGRIEEVRDFIIYYHAGGNASAPIVEQEMLEISAALSQSQAFDKISFVSTLKSRANRKPYAICIAVALLTLWNGQGVISYYFSPILTDLGITGATRQTGINGGMAIWNLLCAITGAFLVDRLGRRPLWLASFIGMIIANVPLTITSAVYAKNHSHSAAVATVALLFFYNLAFNIACNPLLYTYTPEILPFAIQSKGLALQIAGSEAALTVNQYVNPIALANIGYYYYVFYLGMLIIGVVIIYFFFPETKGYTPEELSTLFTDSDLDINGVEQMDGREGSLGSSGNGSSGKQRAVQTIKNLAG